MKILTWNINGIRSVKKDQSLKKLFDSLDADIICLQETKVTRDMLEEETAIIEGYNAYFSFSKVRSGYSGVATFCRNNVTPIKAEDKITLPDKLSDYDDVTKGNCFINGELESLNAEGRTVLTEHLDTEGNHIVIMNLYCPRADLENKERTEFKLKFYSLVEKKCKSLIQENKHVIVLGDFNVSHQLIDHCDPDDPEIFDSNPSRQWANTFIWDPRYDKPNTNANTSSPMPGETQSTTADPYGETYEKRPRNTKFIDSFRHFHPCQKSAFTCWCMRTGARQTNYGSRIDYIFSSVDLFHKEFTDCVICPDIEGSDHCPVVATLKTTFQNGGKPPSLCTKYMPEFSGKQQKLKQFFKKSDKNTNFCCINANENRIKGSKTKLKNSEKRPAESLLKTKSQAKRLKTNTGASQGKIIQFFEKKTTKPQAAKSDGQTNSSEGDNDSGIVADKLASANHNDTTVFEERCKAKLGLKTHNVNEDMCNSLHSSTTSSSQSTSSASFGHENPTSLSSIQTDTQHNKEKLTDSQMYPKGQRNAEDNSAAVISSWKNILKGPPPAPLCSGHKEPCVLRTVKNKGPNHGKRFYCCAKPQGHSTNKEARCNYFTWVKK